MITFNTPRLPEKGIATVRMELDLDLSKISSSVKDTLAKYGCGPEDARPFSVTVYGNDKSDRQIAVLATAEGVHHKRLPLLALDEDYRDCRQLLYLNMLYVEEKYQKCGIATSVLDYLPKLINNEMGAIIDAVVLAPVPQHKDADGKIVQLPFGIEFLFEYKKLIHFYDKRNFHFNQSMSLMGRMVA